MGRLIIIKNPSQESRWDKSALNGGLSPFVVLGDFLCRKSITTRESTRGRQILRHVALKKQQLSCAYLFISIKFASINVYILYIYFDPLEVG